jgi:hypothetical protein
MAQQVTSGYSGYPWYRNGYAESNCVKREGSCCSQAFDGSCGTGPQHCACGHACGLWLVRVCTRPSRIQDELERETGTPCNALVHTVS